MAVIDETLFERQSTKHLERRLVAEFGPDLGDSRVREAIEWAEDRFATARVRHFVPILVERLARERLGTLLAAPSVDADEDLAATG